MRAPTVTVAAIAAPVIEIIDVVVIEIIAYGIVVESVIGLIPVFEIVVVEVAVLPLGHISKPAVGREM